LEVEVEEEEEEEEEEKEEEEAEELEEGPETSFTSCKLMLRGKGLLLFHRGLLLTELNPYPIYPGYYCAPLWHSVMNGWNVARAGG
jgi:hypothetical protein